MFPASFMPGIPNASPSLSAPAVHLMSSVHGCTSIALLASWPIPISCMDRAKVNPWAKQQTSRDCWLEDFGLKYIRYCFTGFSMAGFLKNKTESSENVTRSLLPACPVKAVMQVRCSSGKVSDRRTLILFRSRENFGKTVISVLRFHGILVSCHYSCYCF